MKETPAALGYRMPAEWEPHAATWLSWPRREGISFPAAFDRVMPTFRAMVAALIESEPVCINVCNGAHEAEARDVLRGLPNECITYYEIPTNEPWCRDHGPIFLKRHEEPKLAIVDWGHNAWGGKYPPFDLDDVVPTRIGQVLGLRVYDGGMILEGGSIDVNGRGACLTTESCLLNPNRNPNLTREQIEQRLRDFLGVREIFWLARGTEGDDTDGHIDNLARFVDERTVLAMVDSDPQSANYEALQENLARLRETKFKVIELPVPPRMEREDLILPASYANFYIANERVLAPTYDDANDKIALDTIQSAFPKRKVVAIDGRELIWGLGAFHCLTQQQPA
ncbi:MAG: agmatine deiminase family protein [Verrucomicrobiota bacterium]|nr:agmatine deiminase family protein [Verrucomicrobiota bacterium]